MTEAIEEVEELPKGWVWTRLQDVCQAVETKKPELEPEWEFQYIDIASIDNTVKQIVFPKKYLGKTAPSRARQVVKANDIAFSTVRTYLMNIAMVPEKLDNQIASTGFCILRAAANVSSKYIFYYTLSHKFISELNKFQRGTSYPAVRDRDIFDQLFPLCPTSEQERIVEKIEELFSDLDQGIESLKTAQKQLKVYRQAVLKWAFEGKLTEAWREKRDRPSSLKTGEALLAQIKAERENCYQQQLAEWETAVEKWEAIGKVGKKPGKPQKLKELPPLTEKEIIDIPILPEGWKWIQLGEVLDNIEAGKSFRCEERPPKNNEIGVAKVSAVTWGEYDELESKTCLEEDRIEKRFLIDSGDFLFSRANTIELVGACVIAQRINLKVMLSDKTLRFKFPGKMNQKFVLYFLRSRYGRNEIERLATGNQESMRNIGQERILGIRTSFPSFLEQEQIVQEIELRLSICDRLEATIIENLQKAEALRQSILKQAFEGKLVPQDPNDEPAEKLLEQIQQEKAKPKPGKQLSLKDILEES